VGDREAGGDGEMGRWGDGEMEVVTLNLSQGGFCTNVIINSEKKIPKPAPTNQVPD